MEENSTPSLAIDLLLKQLLQLTCCLVLIPLKIKVITIYHIGYITVGRDLLYRQKTLNEVTK